MNQNLWKILKYGRFMGVFPFKFCVYLKEIRLSYSKPFIIYSSGIFTLSVLTNICFPNGDSPKAITLFYQMTNIFAAASHILILSFKKEHLECFINKIQKVDKLIGKGFMVKEKKCAKIEICIFAFIFPLIILDSVLSHKEGNIYNKLNLSVSKVMFFYMDTAIILNYKSCVKVIKAEILNFRENLLSIFVDMKKQYLFVIISKRISELDKNHASKMSEATINFSCIVDTYRNIFEATEALNSCYNIPILISSMICMANIIIIPFLLYWKVTEFQAYTDILLGLDWLIGHILKILIIVEPCHSCQKQGRDLAQLLMRYSCKTYSRQANQLKKFYVLMKESPIQFHIGGITNITRSVLPAILSGFTTYLVILFQMKNDIF